MEESKVKRSMVLSGLVSTAGLFAAKLIGLLYTIPFSYILANDAYSAIYGGAYRIYSYFLNVFTAGFPFAISTLVAKYSVLDNPKTVLMIKRMSVRFLMIFGALGMLVLAALSPFLAPLMIGAEYTDVMRNVLIILALALFFVPVLSAYRGVVQGRKEMAEYAFSQTFEQLFRVGFLLTVAFLCVYVFHTDRVWALYGAVLSTSVAAAAGIWQVVRFNRKNLAPVEEAAKVQKAKAINSRLLFNEFFAIAMPYFIVAVLGYSDDIFNSVLLPIGLRISSYTEAQASTITSVVNFSGTKLTAIPMILAPGFTAALIPHISEALETRNMKLVRKNVLDCLNIILFIGIPVSFAIFLYAKPICNTLFYTDDLDLAASVTQWIALEGFLGTLTPVTINLMMALRERRYTIRLLAICTVIKGVLMVPFVYLFGFPGAVISSSLGYLVILIFSIRAMHANYKINFSKMYQILFRVLIATAAMWVTSAALNVVGLDGLGASKMMALIQMAVNGVVSVAVFAGISLILGIPQSVFHLNMKQILD